MRAFVALDLSDDAREQLVRAQDELRVVLSRQGVRWVAPEKMHLTLLFLGNVPVDSADEIERAIREAAQPIGPFDVEAADLGAFPNARRPGVIWVGVHEPNGHLLELQQRVAQALALWVERPDPKPFHPHLTLARISPPSTKMGFAMQPLIAAWQGREVARWSCGEALLYETAGDGSYRRVAEAPLAG